MGNNPSSSSRSGTRPTSSGSPSATGSGHASPHHQRREHRESRDNRRSDGHTIIPAHTTQRSVVPPEPSLAQAQGSTIVHRPKTAPTTAVSSLSGSPHSNLSSSVAGKYSTDYAHPRTRNEPQPETSSEPTRPVDVPHEASSLRSQPIVPIARVDSQLVSHGSITDMYSSRQPRLPLPIEEEIHTPGSPILASEEGEDLTAVDINESTDVLTRKSSTLSATTVDEEDAEELRVDKTRPVVATKLEWVRGGDKVYVTGTIFQWNRKHRLHPVEGKPGCYAAWVHILPGTHHLRFLVDGVMQTSPDLPTTVDFGNNLVNYIEVNPDDVAHQKRSQPTSKSDVGSEADNRPSCTVSVSKDQPRTPKGKAVAPAESYESQIPQYLLDFDQAEESKDYQNALAAIEKLPNPPSLPGFLGKPILNAATLMKDDNSVLNMPNHTVLNHLATSSIKNNILAVSATTRYRNKYVTTIMYKPTSTAEG